MPTSTPGCPAAAGRGPQVRNASSLFAHLLLPRRGWTINIGASDAACRQPVWCIPLQCEQEDPANCLFQQGYAGIAFEGNTHFRPQLEELSSRIGPAFELHNEYMHPSAVVDSIKKYAQRHPHVQLDLLKVDIDNCDCCFVERILATGLRPRLVHVEISILIPPPFVFRPVDYNAEFPHGRSPLDEMSGGARLGHMSRFCSLSAYTEILEPFGYRLVQVAMFDALFASQETIKKLGRHAPLSARDPASPDKKVDTLWHWLQGHLCHPAYYLNDAIMIHEYTFLYDYRRWSDPAIPWLHRLKLLQAYLDHWGVPRDQYELYARQ